MGLDNLSKPVVEVYPRSMLENREPNIIEHAYGVIEKTGERIELPMLFPLKEKAIIHTHNWLASVVYRFDPERGVLSIQDIYPPSPIATYTVETIGGERIRKYAIIGILYIYTKPIIININQKVSGLTRERLRADILLSSIEVQVRDITKFLLELWRRHGIITVKKLIQEIQREFKRNIRYQLPNLSIEDLIIFNPNFEESIKKTLSELLSTYGIEIKDVDIQPIISDNTYNYYFWHILNELPLDYAFLTELLRSLPESLQEKVPYAIEAVVLSIISRNNPKIIEALALAKFSDKLSTIYKKSETDKEIS